MAQIGTKWKVGQRVLVVAGTNLEWTGTLIGILPDSNLAIDFGDGYSAKCPAWRVMPDDDFDVRTKGQKGEHGT